MKHKNKNSNNKKTDTRTIINTALLLLMSVIFGISTICGISQIKMASKNFQGVYDSPTLCFEKIIISEDGYKATDGTYICPTEVIDNDETPLVDSEDYTLFLYDKLTFSSVIRSGDLITVFSTIGFMFTIASLVGAIIYWVHNR